MEVDTLKCEGQCPKLTYTLAMSIRLLKHISLLTITLRCFHDSLLGPGVDKLLHLIIKLLNSKKNFR